jgi:hypothetical protein
LKDLILNAKDPISSLDVNRGCFFLLLKPVEFKCSLRPAANPKNTGFTKVLKTDPVLLPVPACKWCKMGIFTESIQNVIIEFKPAW